MECVDPGKNFSSWREASRDLLERRVSPQNVLWETGGLFGSSVVREEPSPYRIPKVPAAFLDLAQTVAYHNDPARWSLLYQILWRITHGGERHLPAIASDPDMAIVRLMEKSVRREIHKMHAFVRFRLIDTDAESGRERYAAWFEPDHFIVEPGSTFFKKRFSNMDWSILTPKGCSHWNGKSLVFTPGIAKNPIDNPDELETAWLTYYRNIFNPARLKIKMMQTEMPKRYWKNLPEAGLIEELIESSKPRVVQMFTEEERPVKPRSKNAYLDKLQEMSEKERDE
ncbi:MAG: TIGR03915 family putative DNA repair protein [Verrucomicrobiota bacterium]